MCLVEKFEFLKTQLRDPHFGASNFAKYYLFLIFANFENFKRVVWVVKKFEF